MRARGGKSVDAQLDQISLSTETDCLFWRPGQLGLFTVRSFHSLLTMVRPKRKILQKTRIKEDITLLARARVCFFRWETAEQAVLTKAKLKWIFGDKDDTCVLCNGIETLDHLLLCCHFSGETQGEFSQGFGNTMNQTLGVNQWLKEWRMEGHIRKNEVV